MAGVLFVLGVILLLIGVAASIALHEIGHLLPAKKFGVKVTQYMVGFGPTLWSRRKGETEYGIKGIPLGGYIRMIGMFPPARGQEDDGMVRVSSTGRFSQLADQMREAAYEPIAAKDKDRVFYKLPTWKKVVVMFGGPFMNLVIALVLLVVVASGIGLNVQKTASIHSVQQCQTQADGTNPTSCSGADRAPATAAGLQPGDRVLSAGGEQVTTTRDLTGVIRSHAGQPVPVVVQRGDQRLTLTVTPKLQRMAKLDDSGTEIVNWKGQVETESVGVMGASIGGTYQRERQSVPAALGTFGNALERTASVFVKIPQKMVGVGYAAFGDGTRDKNGPQSVVGVGRTAGDVASAPASVGDKLTLLLMIIASLNLALFVFNLVPLLPLDGGHIAGALWEAVKRLIARARGIEGPVYVDVAKALPVAYGVSILLLVMFGLLAYADIVNPIKFG